MIGCEDAMRYTLILSLGLAVIFCSGLDAQAQTQDNPVVVNNPKKPSGDLHLTFTEELSIGVAEGDDHFMFGNRVYFNVDDDGNIFANDWDVKRILKYGPDGEYLLTIGGPGQGPGEFQNVWRPRFDTEGRMYVSDYVARRISFFDRQDGRFLSQIIFPQQLMNFYVTSQGLYIGERSREEEGPQGEQYVSTWEVLDSDFKMIRELHRQVWIPKPSTGRDRGSRAQFIANILSDSAYKAHGILQVDRNDSIWYGSTESYEIKIMSLEGTTEKIIRREYDPIKIGKKHKDAYIRAQEDELFRYGAIPQEMREDIIKLVKYPKFKPAFESFTVMDNGWLVVIVDTIPGEYALLDLFDDDGRYRVQVKCGIFTQNLLFKAGKAYVVATHEGYRYIKRYAYTINHHKRSDLGN
jgi:hypothetical protein